MKLQVNGKPLEFESPCSVEALIQRIGQRPERVAVQVNLEIVKRDQYSSHMLSDGDEVEILQFVGGG